MNEGIEPIGLRMLRDKVRHVLERNFIASEYACLRQLTAPQPIGGYWRRLWAALRGGYTHCIGVIGRYELIVLDAPPDTRQSLVQDLADTDEVTVRFMESV